MKKLLFTAVAGLTFLTASAQTPDGGATELTPSRSEYFSWINNTNEGATDHQTLANLDFFQWLHNRYGMTLDIYAFDAGAIDGAQIYGTDTSERFRKQFPNGFGPLADKAAKQGTRLGIWGGPDGFGDTEEEAQARIDMMAGLVEKYNFWLFKMDAVCGQLRPEKYPYFIKMMQRVRKASPDFVLLNHRLNLGEGTKYSTTFLLGGMETYVDVFLPNPVTAKHHRAGTLSRECPPGLTRLTEDHGVCISSCLDGWDDDLILQAFARNLILAPEIYGSPWLLRDDEFPRLAFIFNLHRQYRDILVKGMRLPETYGPEAVARGSEGTRFLALRNLTWNTVKYRVQLGEEIGLQKKGRVQVRQYHPHCMDLGQYAYGQTIEVEVQPFRAALVKVTTEAEKDRVKVSGTPYYIVCDKEGAPIEIELLGLPGTKSTATITTREGGKLTLDGKQVGKRLALKFDGKQLALPYHRQLPAMEEVPVPSDADALYIATAFAADGNAMECRSLKRSGETNIPQVKAARDEFFQQEAFVGRCVWDKFVFDGNPATGFSFNNIHRELIPNGEASLLIDMGQVQQLDTLVIECGSAFEIGPHKVAEGKHLFVSADLVHWKHIIFPAAVRMPIDVHNVGPWRYAKLYGAPFALMREVYGVRGGKRLSTEGWRANNMLRDYRQAGATVERTWKSTFTLPEVAKGSYLCIAINGHSGWESAWAALKVDGQYVGCPDRAPSFASNVWEHRLARVEHNYTFYVPVTPDMIGKTIEAYAMLFNKNDVHPEVWITTPDTPFERKKLVVE